MGTVLKSGIIPDFHVPTQIFIKPDIIRELGSILRSYGSRVVLVTTSRDVALFGTFIEQISRAVTGSQMGFIIYDEVADSPNSEYADSAAYFIKKSHCDIVVGFGGMDAINVAKAAALLAGNNFFCEDLFENPEANTGIPLVTIPAYPSLGYEIMPMLCLNSLRDNIKRIYSDPNLFPTATIIDPQVSTIVDEETTAYTSLAALSIATESVISKNNNSLVNTYALKAIDLTFRNLPLAFREPKNTGARGQLALASVMAGISFSVSRLSISMAVALALASRTALAVHKAMSVILPHVMEYNLTSSPAKYVQMSKVMDEDVREITVIEAAIKAVEGVRKLEMDMDIPQRLSQFDVPKAEFTKIAEIANSYPFLENAPRPLSRDEIETILIAAY